MAMNYLEKKREEQQAVNNGGGLQGVSQQTQAQLQNYQQGYQPSEQVTQAKQNLQAVQQQKPQSYSSKYGAQLESILQQIQNPKEFKYDFNGDALFKAYADMYTQQAKQGAQNAAGIAAGLTGGYGNTYAQSAANQAYQQNLSQLYDRGIDFMNAAYDRYAADRADKYNQLGAVQSAESTDYNRYRDLMQDYNTELDRAREDARYEDETGYNRYADMLKYWQNQAAAENADYRTGEEMDYRYNALDEEARQYDQSMAENQRQFDESMAQTKEQFAANNKLDWANLEEKQRQYDGSLSEEQRQYNQNYALSLCSSILASGKMPSNELLVAAGISYEDAQKLMAEISTGGPGPKKEEKVSKTQQVVNNTANALNAIGNEVVNAQGNGIVAAIQNSGTWALYADAFQQIANDPTSTPEEKAEAQKLANQSAGMAYNKNQNQRAVDEYIKKILGSK